MQRTRDHREKSERNVEKIRIRAKFFQKTAEALSIGEKKRLALAAALIESPDVLILDEPTVLSVEGVEFLETAIRKIRKWPRWLFLRQEFADNVSTNILEWTGLVVVINTVLADIPRI